MGQEILRDNISYVFSHLCSCVVLMCLSDTAGACSMLPKERGGVVDTNLKVLDIHISYTSQLTFKFSMQVYGTENIRVADLSVLPILVAAHTQCKWRGTTFSERDG